MDEVSLIVVSGFQGHLQQVGPTLATQRAKSVAETNDFTKGLGTDPHRFMEYSAQMARTPTRPPGELRDRHGCRAGEYQTEDSRQCGVSPLGQKPSGKLVFNDSETRWDIGGVGNPFRRRQQSGQIFQGDYSIRQFIDA